MPIGARACMHTPTHACVRMRRAHIQRPDTPTHTKTRGTRASPRRAHINATRRASAPPHPPPLLLSSPLLSTSSSLLLSPSLAFSRPPSLAFSPLLSSSTASPPFLPAPDGPATQPRRLAAGAACRLAPCAALSRPRVDLWLRTRHEAHPAVLWLPRALRWGAELAAGGRRSGTRLAAA